MTAEPWPLPDSWHWSTFAAVARVASDLVDPKDYPSERHIAPNHIERETGRLLPSATIAEDGVTSAKHQFRAGQILYSKIRPYLAKVVVVDFDGLCSADMYPIETELDPRFLKWWMLTREFTRQAAEQQARTILPKINKRALGSLPIPVAPRDEQRRIVDILEDHLSRLDAAEALLKKTILRLRVLHKSVLLDLIPDVSAYPAHWSQSTVSEAGEVGLGRQRHPDWHKGTNMRSYLRVANVFEDSIDVSDVMEMHWPGDSFERFRLKLGDVLLNEGQSPEFLGRPAMYRGEPVDVAFTNTLIRFQANDHVLPEYALLVFRRHMHAGRFARESRITTNIAHLSASRLKPIEFPIPPLDEQKQLVDLAEQRLGNAARLSEGVLLLKLRNEGLRRALLRAAFSGRLTGRRSDMEMVEAMASV